MTFNKKAGSFLWDATHTVGSTYTLDLGEGFDPKVLRVWAVGPSAASDAVANGDADLDRGFAISAASRRAIAAYSQHDVGSSVCYRAHRDDCVLCRVRASGTAGRLDVTTWASNQIVLTVDQQANGSARVFYEVLGGDDFSDVAIGDLISPTTAGVVSYSDPGFQPHGVEFLAVGFALGFSLTPSLNVDATQGSFMVGFASGPASDENGVVHTHSRHGQGAADTYGYCRSGECIAVMNASGSVFERAVLEQFDADGFDLDWLEVQDFANTPVSYLCWKGPSTKVGSITTRDSAGSIAESGIGFQPESASFFSACRAEDTQDAASAHAELSIGVATDTDVGALAYLDVDGADPTSVTFAVEYDALYINLAAGSLAGLIALTTYDSGGFTLDQIDADPDPCHVLYLAMAAAGSALTPVSSSASPAFEWLGRVATERDVSFAWDGPIAGIVGPSFEWTGPAAAAVSPPFEWKSLASRAVSPPFEVLAGVRHSRPVPYEWLISGFTAATIPFEIISTRVGRSLAVPFEIVGRIASGRDFPAEWLGRVAGGRAIPFAWQSTGIIVARDLAVPFEWMGPVSAARAIPYETLQRVEAAKAIPAEWLQRVEGGRAVAFEYQGGVLILSGVTSSRSVVWPPNSHRVVYWNE